MSSLHDGFATDGITPIPVTGRTPVKSQDEINSDPAGSSTTIARYSGLRADIDALVTALNIPGLYPYQISQIGDSPTAVLTITYSGGVAVVNEPISIDHVFRTGLSQVPLQEHPDFAPTIRALSDEEKSELKKFMDGDTSYLEYPVPAGLHDFAAMIAEGINTYQRPDPTYTYQARYHAESNFKPSFARVGTVYSTANLISELPIPPDFSPALPVGEWLATEVEYERAGDGSRSAMQSFWFMDDWDDRIYPHFTPPPPP